MSCPEHEFSFNKRERNLKKHTQKYSSAKLKNKIPSFLKILLLIFTVIGLSGVASANTFSENSSSLNLHSATVKNGTVFIENGFSGIVSVKDPMLKKTVKLKVDYQPSRAGSGFLVTKNGYIITAFHVVSDPKSMSQKKLKKVENKDTKWYVEKEALMYYLGNINTQLGQKMLKKMPKNLQSNQDLEKKRDYITKSFIKKGWISTNSYKYSIYVKGPALKGINANNSLEASLIDVGDSKSDKDIALLKVNPTNGRNLPALNISSNNPKINEKISIHGYSGAKSEQNSSSDNINKSSKTSSSNYTPSSSSGHITAKTSNSRGINYYKTNAIANKGYSGGPVVNSENRVVGILIYGIHKVDKSKKEKRVGTLFLSPKYITEISNKNKVPINAT